MRRRLVAVALAVTAMIVLAFIVPLGGLVRELARSRALNGAERDAELVARLVTVVAREEGFAEALSALGLGDEINGHPVSLILPDRTVIGAPVPASEDVTVPLSGVAGDRTVDGGAAVYVPVVRGEGTVVVRIFVPDGELTENVGRSWAILGLLGLVLILIGVFAADRLGRSLVRPVEDLSSAATQLGSGDLEARVEPSGPPELVAVGQRFNELAGRVGRLLQEERETTADLSHRLRTPLTVLRLDTEALPDGPDRDRLTRDLDDLERAVDHIIRESRRAGRQGEAGVTDVAAVVAERATLWQALADEQGRTSSFTSPEAPLPVRIPSADLAAAVDAVLDNVFAHTAEQAQYAVAVERNGTSVTITIDDAGPGLPGAPAIARGASTAGSTGLGLDIARRTAEAAGGGLRFGTSPLGGARIVLDMPLDGV